MVSPDKNLKRLVRSIRHDIHPTVQRRHIAETRRGTPRRIQCAQPNGKSRKRSVDYPPIRRCAGTVIRLQLTKPEDIDARGRFVTSILKKTRIGVSRDSDIRLQTQRVRRGRGTKLSIWVSGIVSGPRVSQDGCTFHREFRRNIHRGPLGGNDRRGKMRATESAKGSSRGSIPLHRSALSNP